MRAGSSKSPLLLKNADGDVFPVWIGNDHALFAKHADAAAERAIKGEADGLEIVGGYGSIRLARTEAEINAALAACDHVIVTKPMTLVAAITLPADKTLEFLHGAILTADTNIAAIDASGAHRSWIINPQIVGANNVAHTSNFGILYGPAVSFPRLLGGKITYCYNGVKYFGTDGYMGYVNIESCKDAGYVYNATRATFIEVVCNGNAHGFALWYVNDSRFIGTRAVGNSYRGYDLYEASRNAFLHALAEDNSVVGANLHSGFLLSSNSDRNMLHACVGRKVSAAQQKYGFEIAAGPEKNEIIGGVWSPNQTGVWLDGGTDTIINARDN